MVKNSYSAGRVYYRNFNIRDAPTDQIPGNELEQGADGCAGKDVEKRGL